MAISYEDIKSDRQWRACTGLPEDKFLELSNCFGLTYKKIYGKTVSSRRSDSSNESVITSKEEFLFFILYSLKNGLTYDVLAFNFGMSTSSAKKNQTEGIGVLKLSLREMGYAPAKLFESIDELENRFSEEERLILDGMEHRIQRPKNQEVQKDFYSGKKKPYSKNPSD